jgi:hypothetical protein
MRPTVSALHRTDVYVKTFVLQAQQKQDTGELTSFFVIQSHKSISARQYHSVTFTDPKVHRDRVPLHLQQPSLRLYCRHDSRQPLEEL